MVEELRSAQLHFERKFTFLFEDLYALRSNDPHFTKVKTARNEISYPTRCGYELGDAMENNTHVSSLTLEAPRQDDRPTTSFLYRKEKGKRFALDDFKNPPK